MKTTFTLIALFFVSIAQSAERWHPTSGSQLQMRIAAHGDYDLEVGDRHYRFFQGLVELNNLAPGRHFVQVSESIIGRRGQVVGRRLVYRGAVNVPARSRVFARILPPGRLVVDRVLPNTPNRGRGGPNGRINGGWQDDHWNDYDHRSGRGNYSGYDNDDRWGYDNNRAPIRRNAPTGSSVNGNFQLFMHSISNEAFDKNRLNLGKEYLRYNDLSSQQVIEVMNALSFESSRLEFAKLAYGRVYDPQNYFLVMNALTFSSSKNELQRYISGL